MQVFATSPVAVYSGVGNAFSKIASTEGVRALWRGVSSVIIGAGPAHAIHFGTLEAVKELCGGNEAGNQWLATCTCFLVVILPPELKTCPALAGASGTIAADAFMNPFDGRKRQIYFFLQDFDLFNTVVKQRMQVHKSEFRSVWVCARSVYRAEGIGAFYVSYPTTLAITIPFNAIQYTVYDHLKKFMNPRNEYSPQSHIVAGGIAGAVAAAVTTPLDVAKTILQTRGASADADIRNVRGMADAFRVIWKRDGLKGFGRGLTPRVLTIMPSSALCWMSYEFFSSSFTFPNHKSQVNSLMLSFQRRPFDLIN